MNKPQINIQDWAFARYMGERVLVGRLVESRYPDSEFMAKGHRVITSKIQATNLDSTVETRNSIYKLIGEPRHSIVKEMSEERNIAGLELIYDTRA